MPVKKTNIDGLGQVSYYKRRNSRSIRVTLSHGGEVKVSLPRWVPYIEAERFVKRKKDWIIAEQAKLSFTLVDNQAIGKYHALRYVADDDISRPRGSVKAGFVVVKYPSSMSVNSSEVLKCALRACNKALLLESKDNLPTRLEALASRYGFEVNAIIIKPLKSRWGSCNSKKEITLNSHLMLLPWHLVDYVILHELVHTKVMKHGNEFWNEFSRYDEDALALRKEIRAFRPSF